jgi:hypothetical protein
MDPQRPHVWSWRFFILLLERMENVPGSVCKEDVDRIVRHESSVAASACACARTAYVSYAWFISIVMVSVSPSHIRRCTRSTAVFTLGGWLIRNAAWFGDVWIFL